MILTDISSPELESYEKIHPGIKPAIDMMKKITAENLPVGKYEVDGDRIYVSVSEYETKSADNSKFEAHRDYIDIQMITEGEEIIGFDSVSELTLTQAYKPDIEFYALSEKYDCVYMRPGKISIIFPGEAHAPCMEVCPGNPVKVRKIVAKILS